MTLRSHVLQQHKPLMRETAGEQIIFNKVTHRGKRKLSCYYKKTT